METMKWLISLHGHVFVFMLLTSIRKGSACEAPSVPECYRRAASDTIYHCEWSMNATEKYVTFEFFYDGTNSVTTIKTSVSLLVEQLIVEDQVDIWVVAKTENSDCSSKRSSVVLSSIVKNKTPHNICASWEDKNLILRWRKAENSAAFAEIRFRRHEHPIESWENSTQLTTLVDKWSQCQLSLLSNSSYKVQIRQKSILASSPLWSDWSPEVDVPAELTEKPEVSMKTRLLNGTREVKLTWKAMPHAASIKGVFFSLNVSQSSGCPCMRTKLRDLKTRKTTLYLSYSAVKISIEANNSAGRSPVAVEQLPAIPADDLAECDNSLLDKNFDVRTCLEWYEYQDGDLRPESVITLTAGKKKIQERKKKRKVTGLKDFVRYVYYEHICVDGKPRTVKTCHFYNKENTPLKEPQSFDAASETHSSINLSWKAIPSGDQRGFLTHYSLCIMKISSQKEPKECRNISASLTAYRLENLPPATKYMISLAGATRVGEGPNTTVSVSTHPEKTMSVWWSLGLMIVFFLFSSSCTFIWKRIKSKLFPPVPTPVICFTSYPTENQEMLEEKEEVHDLTIHMLLPEGKSVSMEAEERTVLGVDWEEDEDEEVESERRDSRTSGEISDEASGSTDEALRSSKDGGMADLETEFAMPVYRNGLM